MLQRQRALALVLGGALVVADLQVRLERGEDLVAAHHRAQRVRAHPDVVVADRLGLVHRVEARHRRDLGRREPQHLRAELDAVRRDVALFGLHEVQQRQQRGSGLRIAGDDLARGRTGLIGQWH